MTEDRDILLDHRAGLGAVMGPIMVGAIQLRLREKELLLSALQFLENHEAAVNNGTIVFQLEEKAKQRIEADLRDAAHKQYMEEVRLKSLIREPVARVEVDLGADNDPPKANLTLDEGASLRDTVIAFCRKYRITNDKYVITLENALKQRIVNPAPLSLLLGVVVPNGDRRILGIPEGTNATVETGVFCAKYNVTDTNHCDAIQERVRQRLEVPFIRRILVVLPLDAPDSRKLQLVVREGEQHDLMQLAADFLEFYRMPVSNAEMVANEIHKRLQPIALQIPVGLGSRRQVVARFSQNENITSVVEGFANFFEIDDGTKLAILKRARHGMAPGTFLV